METVVQNSCNAHINAEQYFDEDTTVIVDDGNENIQNGDLYSGFYENMQTSAEKMCRTEEDVNVVEESLEYYEFSNNDETSDRYSNYPVGQNEQCAVSEDNNVQKKTDDINFFCNLEFTPCSPNPSSSAATSAPISLDNVSRKRTGSRSELVRVNSQPKSRSSSNHVPKRPRLNHFACPECQKRFISHQLLLEHVEACYMEAVEYEAIMLFRSVSQSQSSHFRPFSHKNFTESVNNDEISINLSKSINEKFDERLHIDRRTEVEHSLIVKRNEDYNHYVKEDNKSCGSEKEDVLMGQHPNEFTQKNIFEQLQFIFFDYKPQIKTLLSKFEQQKIDSNF